jgi:hypothetical protein
MTVNTIKKNRRRKLAGIFRSYPLGSWACSFALVLSVLFCALPAPAQQAPAETMPGSVTGTVVDPSGASVSKAMVKITFPDQSATGAPSQTPSQEVLTGDDGQFSFTNIRPGSFQLTITATGFNTQTVPAGVLHPGEMLTVPQITMALAAASTSIEVTPPPVEVAQIQLQDEEKQRVLGVIPNFYVTYAHHPVPLDTKQKFQLAWRVSIDPITFVVNGAIAGIEQADDDFKGYGQGAVGYGKRYGASYGDITIGTFLGDALFPSLFKQDPRYFYKGTGSVQFRIMYAIANAIICKGDNGHWQPNYSAVLGSLVAGGISNSYYPDKNRGVGLTFELAAIRLGANAGENILQEFIIRKLTPSLSHYDPAKPN